ncbi:MAG TPA: hypothetical protein DD403_01875, partial [Pseudomonas sp.]|nr:hypothetical protein [Pseudomonas sp.]
MNGSLLGLALSSCRRSFALTTQFHLSVAPVDCAQEPIHIPGTIQPHGLLLG